MTNPKPDPMERAREVLEWVQRDSHHDDVDEILTALSEAGLKILGEDEVVVPRSFVGAVRAFFERSRPFPYPVEYDALLDELAALQEREANDLPT